MASRPLDAIIVPSVRRYYSATHASAMCELLTADLLMVRGRTIADARNQGLRAARACGWHRVMFMDDDIRVSEDSILAAARATRDAQVAAFAVRHFPDNSVVRHAQRLTGADVPVYPSGGAMVVNLQALPAGRQFPEIYNEDWFFMHGLDVAPAGDAQQLPYDPFVPGRAGREEFGDLVAEAIRGREVTSDPEFWAGAIRQRRALLGSLSVPGAAALSVAEAKRALSRVTVRAVATFIRSWQLMPER